MPLKTGTENQSSENIQNSGNNPDTSTNNQQDQVIEDNGGDGSNGDGSNGTDDSANDETYFKFLEKSFADNARALQALQEQNRTLQQKVDSVATETRQVRATSNEPPKVELTPEQEREEFFNNPRKMFRDLIKEELQKTVEPLQREVQSIVSERSRTTLLSKFEGDPRFKKAFSIPLVKKHIENVLEQQVALGHGVDANIVQQAVIQVMGLYSMDSLPDIDGYSREPAGNNGDGNGNNVEIRDGGTGSGERRITPSNSTPANNRNNMSTPAHLRPSPPRAPSNIGRGNKGNFAPLNENEKRLARESNLTDEQFRELQNLSAANVVKYAGDKPKDQGGNK